ncbi:MAG: carboxymuconolactone decarboxylase family protein [Acidobacteria bacterium]|nr:carboxymuconolactone decarboxylase family protein [Acidobacteriota bacterium]
MSSFRITLAVVLVFATMALSGPAQQTGGKPKTDASLPKDIDPISRNRLPLVNKNELDEHGRKIAAELQAEGKPLEEIRGPESIRAHSPHVLEYMRIGNRYLRSKAGIPPRLVELTILVAARAMDNAYEWNAHEAAARKAGLEQNIIDVVKYVKPVTGLGEKEAVIIQIGREAYGKHQVSSDTFARGMKLFGRTGLVNVVSLMAHYSATAVLLTVFDQHLPEGQTASLPIPAPRP